MPVSLFKFVILLSDLGVLVLADCNRLLELGNTCLSRRELSRGSFLFAINFLLVFHLFASKSIQNESERQ